MIQVCCYQGCGIVYGEKEPFSNKNITHGLCSKHLQISLTEIGAEMKMYGKANKTAEKAPVNKLVNDISGVKRVNNRMIIE